VKSDPPPFLRWRTFAGAWTLFGLYMACQDYVVEINHGRTPTWSGVLPEELIYSTCWAALTPLVLLLTRRFPVGRGLLFRRAALHLFLSAAVSLLHRTLFTFTLGVYRTLIDGQAFSWERELANLLTYVDYGILLYWLLLLIGHAVDSFRIVRENELRASHLETQLSRAQLQALRMQLQPHFLFNTLNAISVLIRKDPEVARKTVARLSELLRITLEGGASQEVPLATELEFLTRYLEIEQTRFGDRLSVSVKVDAHIREARVPGMILQPLVENAIKHGVSRRRGKSSIEIRAQRGNGTLCLSVRNDGPQIPAGEQDTMTEGVGLSNTRARLRQLYGEGSRLTIRNHSDGGVVAEIMIPFKRQA